MKLELYHQKGMGMLRPLALCAKARKLGKVEKVLRNQLHPHLKPVGIAYEV